jgi:hypothetical protein
MNRPRPLPETVTRAVRAAVESGTYPTSPDEWNTLSARELAEPLPPVPWVCEGLGLAPGAVSLFAGYGYSRKTMALQSLGLSVALGRPVWGLWGARQGSFVHLDYEQGRRLTQERYQRLARGIGAEIGDLDSSAMRVCVLPRSYLDEPEIGDRLVKLLDGSTFVLVDSLRAAFPHADENSSDIRGHLDVLSRVSERTGAAIAVIHHARKPSQQASGTATHVIRGSSALFDACQSVYVFEGEKDTPTRVHHQKDRVRGVTLPEFGLTSEDVPGPTGLRHGLIVRHLDAEQMNGTQEAQASSRAASMTARALSQLSSVFRSNGGRMSMSRADIRSMCHMTTKSFDLAWSTAKSTGKLVAEGDRAQPVWKMVSDDS